MSAGQSSRATNGAGPVKILRPGDPGFPKYEDAPAQTRKTCQHPGCTTVFEPSNAQRKYCADHGTKVAEQERWRMKLATTRAASKPEARKTRRCFQCGKDYVPTGNAQRTCQDCKSKAIPPTKPKTLKDIQVRKTEADPRGTPAHVPGAKLDAGKTQLSLVFHGFARALEMVGRVATHGAAKYSPNGWQSVPDGQARYTEAMLRHFLAEPIEPADAGSGLPHAAHLAWNALARLELMLTNNKRETRP
jgi:DNA-directed RNA polymerase subunit RPC12/RpoP